MVFFSRAPHGERQESSCPDTRESWRNYQAFASEFCREAAMKLRLATAR